MKQIVDKLYSIRGYPVAARFTDFKTDLFANGSTPAIVMDTASTTGVSITAATTTAVSVIGSATDAFKCSTGTFTRGINLGGTLTTGITIGACTTGFTITGTTTTAISLAGATTTGISITGATQLGIGLGSSGTPLSYSTVTYKALAIYSTCDTTNASTSFEPVLFNTVMTGAGQVGGRVKANMSTNVILGGWANAFKGQVECNTNGRCTGLLSAVCAELVLPASNVSAVSGNYAPVESELNCPTNHVSSAYTAFMFMGTGGNATAIAAWNAAGCLFILNGFTAATSATNVFHTTGTVSATHGLRIRIDGVAYDILLKASTYA